MNNYIQDIIKLQLKKTEVKIKEMLTERIGHLVSPFHLEEELSRRFPRLMCDISADGTEKWYWNDGSISGKLILTVKHLAPEYPIVHDEKDNSFRLTATTEFI